MNRPCVNCKLRPKTSSHRNAKYCEPCRLNFLKRPKSTMTREQRRHAKTLIGKMPAREIAEQIGVSMASLKRAFRGRRLAFHNYLVAQPELVKAVCAYYEKHGRPATEKKFPTVRVRSIVERYKKFKPRQVRWNETQIIEAARMAGLISISDQAKFFNRPNAHEGSIKSLWTKRFGFGAGSIHGMSHWVGRHLVNDACPLITTKFWSTRRARNDFSRRLYLWVDMEQHLRSELPGFVADAVRTLAEFQRWVFGSKDPKSEIVRLIEERSR